MPEDRRAQTPLETQEDNPTRPEFGRAGSTTEAEFSHSPGSSEGEFSGPGTPGQDQPGPGQGQGSPGDRGGGNGQGKGGGKPQDDSVEEVTVADPTHPLEEVWLGDGGGVVDPRFDFGAGHVDPAAGELAHENPWHEPHLTDQGTIVEVGTIGESGTIVERANVLDSGTIVEPANVLDSGTIVDQGTIVDSGTIVDDLRVDSAHLAHPGQEAEAGL